MKLPGIIILAGIAASAAVVGIPQLRQEVIKLLTDSQCNTEVRYKLGTIDPKFGLSQKTITERIRAAARIWDKEWGKPLFSENSTAQLTINLVYDERAALNTSINKQEDQLSQKNKTINQQIAIFQAQETAFKEKLAKFFEQAKQFNQSQDVTTEMYNDMIRQQNELKAESERLNAKADELNQKTTDYNLGVNKINEAVDQFNQVLKLKPEEGLYSSNNKTITIYYALNPADLVHTLAHEFGHVLEMEHITDPKGIMYPFVSETLELTSQDKAQLEYACREQWVWNLWIKELRQRNLSNLSD